MAKIPEFLIWLICVGISAILIVMYLKYSKNLPLKATVKEGFAVRACPSDTNSYITDDGATECCNGDVVDGYCTGNVRCSLSPKSRYQMCSDVLAAEASVEGAKRCPSKLIHYFDAKNRSERAKGCSVSPTTGDGTAPSDPNLELCILYATDALNRARLDSCYNYMLNQKRGAKCEAAERTAALPACVNAAKQAEGPAQPNPACPVKPEPNFLIHGKYMGGQRVPIQRKYVMSDSNIIHAVQQGEHAKMVITDKNNLPITARYYVGSINELQTRVPDMERAKTLGDAQDGYLLATAS
jgi:hypothetical protein